MLKLTHSSNKFETESIESQPVLVLVKSDFAGAAVKLWNLIHYNSKHEM